MVHWLWLVFALIVGATAGVFVLSLCVMSGRNGCVCECEANCKRQFDGQ